jgi:hypothetical protein
MECLHNYLHTKIKVFVKDRGSSIRDLLMEVILNIRRVAQYETVLQVQCDICMWKPLQRRIGETFSLSYRLIGRSVHIRITIKYMLARASTICYKWLIWLLILKTLLMSFADAFSNASEEYSREIINWHIHKTLYFYIVGQAKPLGVKKVLQNQNKFVDCYIFQSLFIWSEIAYKFLLETVSICKTPSFSLKLPRL